METDAILCTACGYNAETGEEMESVAARPPAAPKKKRPPVASSAEDVRMREAYIKQERSLKVAATLFFAGGMIYMLAGGFFLFVQLKPPMPGSQLLGFILAWLGFVICAIGWGARKFCPWARVPFIVFNLINLLSFPIGTLISAICINHSVGDKGRFLFSSEYSEIIRRTPQVKAKTSIWGWLFLAIITLMIAGIVWGIMQTD
ncbi:MAG: hypothetical protein ACPGVU_05610 [Limisphaerales bacterium]